MLLQLNSLTQHSVKSFNNCNLVSFYRFEPDYTALIDVVNVLHVRASSELATISSNYKEIVLETD